LKLVAMAVAESEISELHVLGKVLDAERQRRIEAENALEIAEAEAVRCHQRFESLKSRHNLHQSSEEDSCQPRYESSGQEHQVGACVLDHLTAARREAADTRMVALRAARGEALAAALARRHECAARRAENLASLLTAFRFWEAAIHETRHQKALREALQELERRQEAAIARIREENRRALHQAWNRAADAFRQVAALERRCAQTEASSTPLHVVARKPSELLPQASSCRGRPRTAMEVERRLQLAEDGLIYQQPCHVATSCPSSAAAPMKHSREGLRRLDNQDLQFMLCQAPAAAGHTVQDNPLDEVEKLSPRQSQLLRILQCQQSRTALAVFLGTWHQYAREARRESTWATTWTEHQRKYEGLQLGARQLLSNTLSQQMRHVRIEAFLAWRRQHLEARVRSSILHLPQAQVSTLRLEKSALHKKVVLPRLPKGVDSSICVGLPWSGSSGGFRGGAARSMSNPSLRPPGRFRDRLLDPAW